MTKERQFWNWFRENEGQYFFLSQIDDNKEKERILDELLKHLHLYCENLFFEVGGYPNEKQDLIITAAGDENFFAVAESLVDQAPILKYWNIIALKPPKNDNGIVKYNIVELNPFKMFFRTLTNENSKKIGLRIYVENYNSDNLNDFLNAAYIVVDNILGEKSSALDIDHIELINLTTVTEIEKLIEITKLSNYIKWKKSKTNS